MGKNVIIIKQNDLMDEREFDTQTQQKNPPRNVVMGIIIFLAVMGAAVGGLSIVRNVRSPFIWVNAGTPQGNVDMSEQAQAAARADKLKTQDTDADGLSDFEELYTHKTSPYLKDTDSDTFDDKTEVASGYDPNCPKGQNCFRQELSAKQGEGVIPDSIRESLSVPSVDGALSTGIQPTATQLRELLKQRGFTEEQLSQIDDATLIQSYQESLAAAQTSTPSTLTAEQLANYDQLTPDQIRELARSSGLISEEQLSQIDDATLKQLFLSAVQGSTPQ